jgi:hypothetical protein
MQFRPFVYAGGLSGMLTDYMDFISSHFAGTGQTCAHRNRFHFAFDLIRKMETLLWRTGMNFSAVPHGFAGARAL